jgi:RNA polymerase sigma-70 factor (ECF subfamily)
MSLLTRVQPRQPPTAGGGRPTEKDPEVGLMLRVQQDDAGACVELVQRYRTRLLGFFFRRLGDRQEAEDLTQEVFLRLYRSRKRYQPRARFATWLFHVARNVARNALRSRRHPPAGLETLAAREEGSTGGFLPFRSGEPPSRPLERAELAGVVRAAVSGLAERQRSALELHQFQGRTHGEIAAQLGVSPKAAKTLVYRARRHLRASLLAFMEGEGETAGAVR